MKITADWTNKEALPEKKLTKIFIAALTATSMQKGHWNPTLKNML
jgi:hypothetical protein